MPFQVGPESKPPKVCVKFPAARDTRSPGDNGSCGFTGGIANDKTRPLETALIRLAGGGCWGGGAG